MSDPAAGTINPSPIEWREMLRNRPPGTRAWVDRAAFAAPHGHSVEVRLPDIELYCTGQCRSLVHCEGSSRTGGKLFGDLDASHFAAYGSSRLPTGSPPHDGVIAYTCERCGRAVKSYSLRFWNLARSSDGPELVDVQKLAEWPPFAPSTPSKLITLIGPDRDLFLKGRRAELDGLGIGAFSYYRRIVERQKNRLIDAVIRVARQQNASGGVLQILEDAKIETQFSRAVDNIKDAIPRALFIKGHNPLTLLHSALSEGIHETSDEECLQAANDIRLVLIEFADRLSEALKEQKDLDEALTRLVARKS